ncbi:MAG: multiheme c-type cytochrome [Sulfurimonadaceae bacterium]|jgi:hypothetical protein|nr:multiheme c-type cytochrome [Sulfurimonadaceae bacterium]
MKKLFVFVAFLSSVLFAIDHESLNTQTCAKCHPLIVEEYENSMHRNSTIYNDPIHAAVWDNHPLKEQDKYSTCAECHAPNAKNEEDLKAGITCFDCHTITNIEEHADLNRNVYGKDKKHLYSAQKGKENEVLKYKVETSMFGLSKKTVGSPYHDIDYTNEIYYDGQVCMGCHSHRQNSHGFDLCRTDEKSAGDKNENCITCHMPQVEGSATTIRESLTHAYHGAAGPHNKPEMLLKYIDIAFNQKSGGFDIVVENKSPHALLTHPLRVVELRVNLLRGGKTTPLETTKFFKVIGDDGKPTPPWLAKEVVSDNMIKAKEKRAIEFKESIQSGDQLEVTLGYFKINPNSAEKLGLNNNKEATKFTVLKHNFFTIN